MEHKPHIPKMSRFRQAFYLVSGVEKTNSLSFQGPEISHLLNNLVLLSFPWIAHMFFKTNKLYNKLICILLKQLCKLSES